MVETGMPQSIPQIYDQFFTTRHILGLYKTENRIWYVVLPSACSGLKHSSDAEEESMTDTAYCFTQDLHFIKPSSKSSDKKRWQPCQLPCRYGCYVHHYTTEIWVTEPWELCRKKKAKAQGKVMWTWSLTL